jgi:hypothetical protein
MRSAELVDRDPCVECGVPPRRGVEVERASDGFVGMACWPCLRRNRRRVGQMEKERDV